ncbi:deoxynucleoside triphosphate triphosphohydrolase SAMHD1-like [Dreissena polymorpha]|uniref:deoxynucleoside triphosphate triphosphohydrolase SAMHD1-like n=1 Tax=Dreissena polymorpha TaxID=45954 RepID=UPI0022644F6F|nr:deoxynucleoside triphosphate triphosphohydrolase SAMHD1-like [Dreissena polymorpha]
MRFGVFNDPVHGHISMHPLCVLIIDTPEFQRLRHIKQINAAYFVFPGASHNRFEHSLGVCYLAGRVVRKLKKQKQPNLDINDKDILCVQIAGLCNDLGHGPFSYLFEHRFLPQMQPNCKWTHKEASVMMFSRLIEKNNLIDKFKLYGLENEDITFIKELLNVKAEEQDPEWKYTGRDESKRFLFEIVTNVRNGIDAETWDSCARDCLMLGMSSRFDHMRCIKYVRAIKVKNKYQICFRDKEKRDFDELFFILAKLKDMAYQHKTTFIAGEMIVEALVKVNALILLKGTNRYVPYGIQFILSSLWKNNTIKVLTIKDNSV